jgi:hypothetical protein
VLFSIKSTTLRLEKPNTTCSIHHILTKTFNQPIATKINLKNPYLKNPQRQNPTLIHTERSAKSATPKTGTPSVQNGGSATSERKLTLNEQSLQNFILISLSA